MNCRQNGDSVLSYYGRLSKLWEEIQSFKSSHTCTCDASSHIEKEREDAKVQKFLFGLDESRFSSIRSQITDEDPLPDLNIVYSRVIKADQHLLTIRATELKQDAIGFSIKADSQTPNSNSPTTTTRTHDPNRFCTHCNRKGHEASECFLLHGYLDWFQEQSRNSTQSQRGRGGRTNSSGGRGRGRFYTTRPAPNSFSENIVASSDQIAALISLLQNKQSQLSTERMTGKPSLY